MVAYKTEEEQIEAFKKWWERYGALLTLVVTVIVLAYGGFTFWQSISQAQAEEAADLYQQVLEAAQARELVGSQGNIDAYEGLVDQLKTDYKGTAYANFCCAIIG